MCSSGGGEGSKYRRTPRLPFLISASSSTLFPPNPALLNTANTHERASGENIDRALCVRGVSAVHERTELFFVFAEPAEPDSG